MIKQARDVCGEKMKGTSKTNSTSMLGKSRRMALLMRAVYLDSHLLFAGQSQTEVREIPSCWFQNVM
jgi:hypothetical protein